MSDFTFWWLYIVGWILAYVAFQDVRSSHRSLVMPLIVFLWPVSVPVLLFVYLAKD